MDAASAANTGTSLESIVGSLNGKPLDNAGYQKGAVIAMKDLDKSESQKEDVTKKLLSQNPPDPGVPPKMEDYQTPPMQKFGSVGMVIASLGSLMTRQHMTAALNASAEVMKAQNQGDANAYKDAMDKWKVHSENVWKQAEWENQHVKEILNSINDSEATKAAKLSTFFAMTNNPNAKAAIEAGQIQDYHDKHTVATEKVKEHTDAQNLHADEKEDIISDWMAKNNVTDRKKVPPKVAIMADHQASTNAYNSAHGKYNDGEKFNFDFSGLKPTDLVQGLGLPLAVVDQKAQGLHDGLSYANVGVPMRTTKNPLKDAVDARLAEKYPDFNYKDAQLEKAEQTKELASNAGRTASAKAAVNEMDTLGKPMIDAMKKLDPSEYPDWNSVKNAYEKKSGGADVVKAFQAVQDFKTAFVSLMVKNGVPTDSARATSDDIASINFSLDQIQGVKDQAKITGAAILDALDNTKKGIISGNNNADASKSRDGAPTATDAKGNKLYWDGTAWVK